MRLMFIIPVMCKGLMSDNLKPIQIASKTCYGTPKETLVVCVVIIVICVLVLSLIILEVSWLLSLFVLL